MTKDTLYLLAPGFLDNDRREYCPECAEIWGLLNYFPAIREAISIVYEPIKHPRTQLVARLGEGSWNCPTMVLHASNDPGPGAAVIDVNGNRILDNAKDIGLYFAHRFGTPSPRGS